MPNEEKMTLNERRKYLRLIRKRYLKTSKLERGRLLDEMEAVTGLHRKSLTRLMSGSLERRPRHRQRGRTYGPEVDDALRVISDSFDHICAERLQPTLVEMAIHLAHHGEIEISQPLLDQLSRISLSTVRRTLNRLRHLDGDQHLRGLWESLCGLSKPNLTNEVSAGLFRFLRNNENDGIGRAVLFTAPTLDA